MIEAVRLSEETFIRNPFYVHDTSPVSSLQQQKTHSIRGAPFPSAKTWPAWRDLHSVPVFHFQICRATCRQEIGKSQVQFVENSFSWKAGLLSVSLLSGALSNDS